MNKRVMCCMIAASLLAGMASYPIASTASDTSVVFAADSATKEYGRLSYIENSDGTLTITGCAKDVAWVSIDGAIDGKKITAIAKNAFADCKSLQYVYIGEDVQKIGANAFKGTGISKVTIPASVRSIYANAFSDCPNLSVVCMYSEHYANMFFGENIFSNCSSDLTIYCATGSGTAAYIKASGLTLRQSNHYWSDGLPNATPSATPDSSSSSPSDNNGDNNSNSSGNKLPQSDSSSGMPSGTSSSNSGSGGSNSNNSGGSSNSNSNTNNSSGSVDPGNASSPSDSDTSNSGSLGGRYDNMPDSTKSTYVNGTRVDSEQYGSKIVKTVPASGGSFVCDYTYDGTGYVFSRTNMFVSEKDYIILCNCVANEYGSDSVPEWEMALVAEVIFNRVERFGYTSLYDSIVAPNAFEHSDQYADLDKFSPKVNDRVINAVNLYLSYPEYFQEGYMSFRGDDTWNYFW